jgi:hypothetical protein
MKKSLLNRSLSFAIVLVFGTAAFRFADKPSTWIAPAWPIPGASS